MPPKTKYTREQIIDAAFKTVRESGMSALTARGLAKALGTSTGSVFTLFDSVGEIQGEVVNRAKELYGKYVHEGLMQTPPFKGAGMKYIQFASDEPELFKLLFMSGDGEKRITNYLPAFDENGSDILNSVAGVYKMDEKKARNIYNHMSVYAYGFAALFAQRINMFTMEEIGRMMTEMFTSLVK